jgi:hypothetical protein
MPPLAEAITFNNIRWGSDSPQPDRSKQPTNVHKPGDTLLVRAFDYGKGFEIVNNPEDIGEDFTYYQVEIQAIVPVKKHRGMMGGLSYEMPSFTSTSAVSASGF